MGKGDARPSEEEEEEEFVHEATAGQRAHFSSVILVFCANGLQAGVYTVLVPDPAGTLDLSEGSLSLRWSYSQERAYPGYSPHRISNRLDG